MKSAWFRGHVPLSHKKKNGAPSATLRAGRRSSDAPLRNSLLSDIFAPHFRVLGHVLGKHLNAFVGVGVEDVRTVLDQPIEAAAEINGLADNYGADAELADQAAAIPAGSEGGHHDFVAVSALAARFAKRICFTMRGGIALLDPSIVAPAQQFSIVIE